MIELGGYGNLIMVNLSTVSINYYLQCRVIMLNPSSIVLFDVFNRFFSSFPPPCEKNALKPQIQKIAKRIRSLDGGIVLV